MDEWGSDQEADNVLLMPDGNGEFTDGMGMLVDKSDLGFGKRSWRYSMLVKDGVIAEDVHRAAEAGRPVRGVRRRHDARVHQPEGEEAGPGGDPHARRLRVTALGPRRC